MGIPAAQVYQLQFIMKSSCVSALHSLLQSHYTSDFFQSASTPSSDDPLSLSPFIIIALLFIELIDHVRANVPSPTQVL